MARKSKGGKGRVDVKGELVLTALMFAGIFLIAFALRIFLHLGDIYAPVFTAIIAGIIIFFLYRQSQRQRWERENADAERTVNPIIERYAKHRDARRLVHDFDAWDQDAHEADLRLQFLQVAIEALISDGHRHKARSLLDKMGRIAADTGNEQAFASYKASIDARLDG